MKKGPTLFSIIANVNLFLPSRKSYITTAFNTTDKRLNMVPHSVLLYFQ